MRFIVYDMFMFGWYYFLINSAILKLCDLSHFATSFPWISSSSSSDLILCWAVNKIFLNLSCSSVSPTSINSSSSPSFSLLLLMACLGEQVGLWGVAPSLSAISSSCLGLMSVWVSRWVFRFDLWLKLRWQIGQRWGASSKWSILWTARVLFWQNPFPQSSHLKGFSLEWIYRWFLEKTKLRNNSKESFLVIPT